jgi:hypothetical protein
MKASIEFIEPKDKYAKIRRALVLIGVLILGFILGWVVKG